MDPMNPFPNLMGGAPPPPAVDARQALSVPSLLLILMGALGVAFSLLNVVMHATDGKMLVPLLDLAKDIPPELRRLTVESLKGSLFNYSTDALAVLANALTVFGALRMRAVRSYGLAVTGAVVAMVPGLGWCCCLGIPLGIWAIVTMSKPEVRAQFT